MTICTRSTSSSLQNTGIPFFHRTAA